MRIALHATSEVGSRCGRILLAEGELEALGLVGRKPASDRDPRVHPVRHLDGWDLLVSDALPTRRDLPVPTVIAPDRSRTDGPRNGLLAGCNLASGLGAALAAHQASLAGEPLEVLVAWTEQGSPLRRGEPLPFPDPVGPHWGSPEDPLPWVPPTGVVRLLSARAEGRWAGVIARVTSAGAEGVTARTLGVSDERSHLEAIALAAGALTAYEVGLEGSLRWPWDYGSRYLDRALRVGLEVASFVEHPQPARRRR